MGAMTKKDIFAVLDHYYSQGGNFIDAANNYQSGQAETHLGEWLSSRPGLRDQMVVATKYTFSHTAFLGYDGTTIHSNYGGNGTKSLRLSVEASLKKLQTDYVDILYVHWWDYTTSIPELMLSLNTLCEQGKVLYLGISDTPAWIVSKANEYARCKGLRQFVVYEGRWSAADRDFERDILPMCTAEGMGVSPWGALGGGNFKTKKQQEAAKTDQGRMLAPPSARETQVAKVLENIADRKGTLLTSVALAYVMHKAPHVFPVVGGRKLDHLKGNIQALSLELSKDEMDEIEGAAEFDPGFPANFVGQGKSVRGPKDVQFTQIAGVFDYVEDAMVSPLFACPGFGCALLICCTAYSSS